MKEPIKILIIDDEPGIIVSLHDLLTDEGYVVFDAGEAREAYDILDTNEIDVIICDLLLPDQNGVEILNYITTKYPHIHVIIWSVVKKISVSENLIGKGACSYLVKSLNYEDLLSSIKNCINNDHQHKSISANSLNIKD